MRLTDLSQERKGEMMLLGETLLWGSFPIITTLSLRAVPSILSLVLSTVFAALFFAIVMTWRNKWHELRSPLLWKYSLMTALFIGILYYSFIFLALQHTTPGNVALLGLSQVFTTFLLFNIYKKEFFSYEHSLGALLMVAGVCVVLARDFAGINGGDMFVLIAVCFSPIGNLYSQRARTIASSESIMFVRSIVSAPALLALSYVLGEHASARDVQISIFFLLFNGILLLGFSKLLWIEVIHRISVTKAIALSNIDPLWTLLLAWLVLGQIPSLAQLASLPFLILGVVLLTNTLTFSSVRAVVARVRM